MLSVHLILLSVLHGLRAWRNANADPRRGSDFCATHARQPGKLKYGRFDNEFLDKEEYQNNLRRATKNLRTHGFQYYTREEMWYYAAKHAHVHDLDDLRSEEFEACFAKVDKYFQIRPALCFDWQIQNNKGPQNVGERHTEKAAYNANVQTKKFRFYQRRVFEN